MKLNNIFETKQYKLINIFERFDVYMELKPDEILMTAEDGTDNVFKVLEQTRLGGVDYLLVTPANDGEESEDAFVLKDISSSADMEAIYEVVEDDKELDMVAAIFRELLDDIELL